MAGEKRGLEYYIGPHAYQGLQNLAAIGTAALEYLTPAGDVADAARSSRETVQAIREGRLGDALARGGYTALGAAGVLIPGTVEGYRRVGEQLTDLGRDSRGAMAASNYGEDVVSGVADAPLYRGLDRSTWDVPETGAAYSSPSGWVPAGAMEPRGSTPRNATIRDAAEAFTGAMTPRDAVAPAMRGYDADVAAADAADRSFWRRQAAAIADQGRNGDTMLAHITPEEAQILEARGGAATTNPVTGLPEFYTDNDITNSYDTLADWYTKYGSQLGASDVSQLSDYLANQSDTAQVAYANRGLSPYHMTLSTAANTTPQQQQTTASVVPSNTTTTSANTQTNDIPKPWFIR